MDCNDCVKIRLLIRTKYNLFVFAEFYFIKDSLADFRRAIKYPAMTAGYCFRAIETIRKFHFENKGIHDNDKRRKDGWNKLRSSFDLTQSDFNEIENFTLSNRHGHYPSVTYPERERIMNFTRKIIDKTIERFKEAKVSQKE